MTAEPDIVIVGAGAACMGAARGLSGRDLSVVVIEALPRLGGRAWTQDAAGHPLDLGCGWLHSADRNKWVPIAEEVGFPLDRSIAAWGNQYRDLGFPAAERESARAAYAAWVERLATGPSDCAADALDSAGEWTAYLQALSGFISGDELERISARDYLAYDDASTALNWRVPAGYGALVATSLPSDMGLALATPIEAIRLDGKRVALDTANGTLHPLAAILTVSTNVLAGETVRWPSALDPWRLAASRLPLGANEKVFLEIAGDSPFAPESHCLGDPRDPTTGSYYIRPFGRQVVECFLGGAGARAKANAGLDASYARAIDQLAVLFGADVRKCLRPLIASDWTGTASVGGGYSHALPGFADARTDLARSYDGRIFFAGEATHEYDFSTAHGAFASGQRAAAEVIAALTQRGGC